MYVCVCIYTHFRNPELLFLSRGVMLFLFIIINIGEFQLLFLLCV